ncbi:hypothetical protein PGB90_007780 [Kerria lacca]
MNDSRTSSHMLAIENLVIEILKCDPPKIVIQNWKQRKNLEFTDRLMLKTREKIDIKQIRFNLLRSRFTFTVITYLLSKIYDMLLSNTWYTKRELYYQASHFIRCQSMIDAAIQIICNLLDSPPWEIGIMATSKGLVSGQLVIKIDNEHVIDCSLPTGTLIPHFICSASVELRCSAKYVLLIEKDATFQRLLNENILNKLNGSLLVTGKGFPDVNTRILINKLSQNLKIPVLALVDADPFGIAIMSVYRYGSINMCNYAENLAAPEIKWLGVHPSDMKIRNMVTLPLQKCDLLKLNTLSRAIFIKSNKQLLKQFEKRDLCIFELGVDCGIHRCRSFLIETVDTAAVMVTT